MPATLLLALVGAFHVFAGLVATRAGLTSRLLDQAIAAITLEKTSPAETTRNRISFAIAALTFAGGVLLLAGLDPALWAFLACAAVQAAYLFLIAPRWLDPADPPTSAGRRQSINALVIYLAATALVAWAAGTGRLSPLSEAPWEAMGGVAGSCLLYGLYVLRGLSQPGRAGRDPAASD